MSSKAAASLTEVLVVDDHDVVREGVQALLSREDGIRVVGQCRTGEEALRAAHQLRPDVVLLDLVLPGMDGLQTCRRLVKETACRVVVMTHLHSHDTMLRALQAGCHGFLSKETAREELGPALRAARRGDRYISSTLACQVVDRRPRLENCLTAREAQVLKLIVRGLTNQEMGAEMHISVKTVQTHRANIMQKLGLRTRADLVRYAVQHGLADIGL